MTRGLCPGRLDRVEPMADPARVTASQEGIACGAVLPLGPLWP